MNFIYTYLIKIPVLIIHFFTRTPLIIVYYFTACLGLFGPSHKYTSYCFLFSLSLIVLNLFVFTLFNNAYTKKWAIDIVGQPFFEKYLTHSAPASKSLLRLSLGLAAPAFTETVTSLQNEWFFRSAKDDIRHDINSAYSHGDLKAVAKFQDTLQDVIKNHRSGGLVSKAIKSEAAVKTYSILGETAQSVAGIWKK